MLRVTSQYKNNIRPRAIQGQGKIESGLDRRVSYLPLNTKMLAWGIFLIFFVEAGTLGLLPKSMYFVYRNMRISDLLLYGLVIYSFFCSKEYADLSSSRILLIVKVVLLYFLFQFIISVIAYKVDVIEYFFRLKQLWLSFLLFPYLLLLKRGGVEYLLKLIFPVAIISNIIYIFSALTGVVLLPDTVIVLQDLPGGLKVWRVFGGTFYGEFFMLAIVFYWNENQFKLKYLPLFILFILPHVLAFGRGAWVSLGFSIIFITFWASIRKHNLKNLLRQIAILLITVAAFLYFFNQFVPKSDEYSEAIEARIEQGKTDFEYGEGTYGTRGANLKALLELWAANPIIGIGIHPFWLIKPVTAQEAIYSWGFSDVRWGSILAAYGATGFLLTLLFQFSFIYLCFKILRKVKTADVYYFFVLLFLLTLLRDTVLGFDYSLVTISIYGLGPIISFLIANLVYLYEKNVSSVDNKELLVKKPGIIKYAKSKN